jgi:hypothetical protein
MNSEQIDVKVQVEVLSYVFSSSYVSPNSPREIDPDFVRLGITWFEDSRVSFDKSGSIVLKREDAKKMGLMVGDKITLRLIKNSEK